MSTPISAAATDTSFLRAQLVDCECGRAGCEERFLVTRRQLARVRRRGGTLVAHAHLTALDDLAGIADGFLVLVPRLRKEQHS